MGSKSREKGARGEREAAKYLTKLGFECERNGRNGYSTDDLRLPGLPGVHVEVKFGVQGMDVGTALLRNAWEQAMHQVCLFCSVSIGCVLHRDDDREHVFETQPTVLWKPTRRPWRLTWMEPCGLVTTTGDDAIKTQLLILNGGRG